MFKFKMRVLGELEMFSIDLFLIFLVSTTEQQPLEQSLLKVSALNLYSKVKHVPFF